MYTVTVKDEETGKTYVFDNVLQYDTIDKLNIENLAIESVQYRGLDISKRYNSVEVFLKDVVKSVMDLLVEEEYPSPTRVEEIVSNAIEQLI